MYRLIGSFLLGLCVDLAFPSGVLADTIISVSGTGEANFTLGGDQDQVEEASWTTLSGYSNVSIAAEVGRASEGPSITAYLTSDIGPAETADDLIAIETFAPSTDNEFDTIFSGLNLGPGTYYLVLSGGDSDSSQSAWWGTDHGSSATTDTGVTFDGDGYAFSGDGLNATNPPASLFNNSTRAGLLFQVTGDPEAASPEPGSLRLILIGGLGGLWMRKRLRDRSTASRVYRSP
jgi:hypothetical protein